MIALLNNLQRKDAHSVRRLSVTLNRWCTPIYLEAFVAKRKSLIVAALMSALFMLTLVRAEIPSFGTAETVITSDQLEMETSETENRFIFKGNVRVTSTNLEASCDLMNVITFRGVGEADPDDISEIGSIQKIIAEGNVRIRQMGREATANKAEIHPNKEYVELKGRVKVRNEDGLVEGDHLIMEKNKRVRVVGTSAGERPRVTLEALPDLGVDQEPPEASEEEDDE